MAGQPQDPSWQSGEQDQTRGPWQSGGQDQAQAREAWPPQPSFTPPTPTPAPQDTFVFSPPPPPPYGQSGQPGPGQPGPGQPGPGQPGPGQPGQGYPPPTYNPQDQARTYNPQDQGQGAPPQWQANQGRATAAAPRPRGEPGFLGSLFDFSFKSMVTPKIIKVLYVLITAWVALLAIIFLVIAFRTGGLAGGLFTLIIVDPILVLLSLGAYRVVLELCMVIFRLHEDVKAIRDRGEGPG
jgi:Domain of unknown function (DUF4282)